MSAPDAGRPDHRATRGWGVAFVVAAAQLLVAIPGLTVPGSGFALATWLGVVLPVTLVTTAGLWVFVVPGGGGRTALVCSALALLSLPVFRLGLTLPLAGAALVVGRDTPLRDPERSRAGGCAVGVAALVAVTAAGLAALDAVGGR